MTNVYHKPKNIQKMDELFVALSETKDGEGIISMMTPMGHAPFVFGHKDMMDKLKHHLVTINKETKAKIVIYRFMKCEVIETIE